MHLFRAHAYQVQQLETVHREPQQPEVMVFFEAHRPEAASATLLRLLALAWGCTPADIEFRDLVDEQDPADYARVAERAPLEGASNFGRVLPRRAENAPR